MIVSVCRKSCLLALALLGLASPAFADDISGAGATFPHPVFAKWAETYKAETGVGLNYQAIGSGGGIKQIKAKTVTFGASDMPLKPEEMKDDGLIEWPMVIGGVVPVVNVKGVGPGDMLLDGATLADIYLGEAKFWDDPSIAKLNPKLKLPHQAIVQVYRADGSGTNFLFTHYLSSVNSKFGQKVGEGTSVSWPAGTGAKGNAGVASTTFRTEGAIGYVEYAYADENKLAFTKMTNKDGKVVAPDFEAFQAAAANADWVHSDSYYLILTDQPGAKSWPITGASFILVYKQPADAASVNEALKFFSWAYKDGANMAADLDYVPLPAPLIAQVKKTWTSEITSGGHPVWTGK